MEHIEKNNRKSIKYDYSSTDIANFFEEQKLRFAIDPIIYKNDHTERTSKEIRERLEEIRKDGCHEEWWNEMFEGKIYLKKAISRYLKGKSREEIISENCHIGLPEYIKDHIDTLTKEKTIHNKSSELGIAKNFLGMYHEFKTIFNEDKEKPISEKDLIKKILKVFFNAHKEYEEEYSKAKVEYNEEIQRREDENDANNMYKTYETLYEPEITAWKIIYAKYFSVIDPNKKFEDINKKIFNIFCEEFERAKKNHYNHQQSKSEEIQHEKTTEQNNNKEKIGNLMTLLDEEPITRKVLKDNINPEFEEMDEEGDVIGLTKEHTPLFIDDTKKREKNKYIPTSPFD